LVANNQGITVTSGTLSFLNSNIASPIAPPVPQILDLTQVAGSPGTYAIAAPVSSWISGVDIYNNPSNLLSGTNQVVFDLTSFLYTTSTGDASFAGIFRNLSTGQQIGATGQFTSQLDVTGTNPSSYSITITAVPTPALLPGLVGFGIAAFRKRKSQAIEA
jgi:hypothetical protein